MRLEVTGQLRTLLTLNVINLGEFSIPEKSEGLAAIDTLDVHAERHDDLIVGIGRGLVLEADFHGFVRDLHHLEVVLHLFLKDSVVQDGHSLLVHG